MRVARSSRKRTRTPSRRRDRAVTLLVFGGAFALAPLLLASTRIGKALTPLTALGVLMLGVGALLLATAARRRPADAAAAATPTTAPAGPKQAETARAARPPSTLRRLVIEPQRRDASTPAIAPDSRPTTWSAAVFDAIEWRRFEAVVETLFRQAGFETRTQSHGADSGVDVWLYSRHQPGGPASIVRCKHWSGKQLGVDKVRELHGVMVANNVRRGQFATTSAFSDDAVAVARDSGIHLLDVKGLLRLIAQRSVDQQLALLDVALVGEYWRPTCVNCGVKMVEHPPREGGKRFWGCPNVPRCRKTLPMRRR
jgi:restriction system protein